MTIQTLLLLSALVILLLEIICYRKAKHPLACAFTGAFSGIIVLIPTVFALAGFGLALSVNYVTIAASAILGIPGVLLMAAFIII